MLVTPNLEIWISVYSDTEKQLEHAPVLCYRGEPHSEQRAAKGRRQELGIYLIFQGSESLPTWVRRVSFQQRRMLLLLHMAQAYCLTLYCKQTETYAFRYVLICFLHVLAYFLIYNLRNQLSYDFQSEFILKLFTLQTEPKILNWLSFI